MKLAAPKHTVNVPFFFFEKRGFYTVSETDPFTGPVLRPNLTFVQKIFHISSILVLGAMYLSVSTHMLSNRRGVTLGGRDSSVGIVTGYRLDGPGIESRWERDFPHPSRPALPPTHPPIQ